MERSSAIYKKVIDSFKVEINAKYQPRGGKTYCNTFAQDVMNHDDLNAALPSGTTSTMCNALYGNKNPKWKSVDFQEAQKRANQGYPTIAIKPGHVAIVKPKGKEITQLKEVCIAQAGATNYNSTTINWAWASNELTEVKFYSHYEQ